MNRERSEQKYCLKLGCNDYDAPEGWHIVIDSSVSPSICPSCITLETMKGINMKLHRQTDLIEEKYSAQESQVQASYFWSYCPLFIFILIFCPKHNFKTMQSINMKLHRQINLIQVKCSAQEQLLKPSYFWSNCPMFIFILDFCPYLNSSIQATDLKYHLQIYLIKEKCSAQEP